MHNMYAYTVLKRKVIWVFKNAVWHNGKDIEFEIRRLFIATYSLYPLQGSGFWSMNWKSLFDLLLDMLQEK